jgi:hypothetical protein
VLQPVLAMRIPISRESDQHDEQKIAHVPNIAGETTFARRVADIITNRS